MCQERHSRRTRVFRLLDRVLNFFWGAAEERQRAEVELRNTPAFSRSHDFRLIAHSMAHTEGLHRVIQGMVN